MMGELIILILFLILSVQGIIGAKTDHLIHCIVTLSSESE